ncbi:MAG: adenosylcobinamide-phosphate synthase CbiB [Rhodospirillaceae bacterium]|nr:adenosylcobinamide-phosphate synthase CbiB [Rhodospirillaceae bacterium]
MLLFAAPDWPIGPAAPFILLLALALDALIGDPRWLPHPVRLMGWLTGLVDRALNREGHGESVRMFLGVVAVLLVVGASAAAGWAVARYAGALGWGWLAELALVAMLIAQRDMADHMVRVARALDRGAEPARDAVRHIVGRDLRALDEHGIARAAIESGAENYSDGVVAPAFWYLLLGLPGLLAYKAINTMDSMIGHRSPRHHAFGRAAARIDDAVNWVPARIAGALIAFAALAVPGARPGRAWRTMLRDAPRHSSPNAGWPEAAMAGALGLALLGPRHYEGEAAADQAWLGDGRRDATACDLRRTVRVFAAACALVAALTAAIAAGMVLGRA